jgi:hypothetical protein
MRTLNDLLRKRVCFYGPSGFKTARVTKINGKILTVRELGGDIKTDPYRGPKRRIHADSLNLTNVSVGVLGPSRAGCRQKIRRLNDWLGKDSSA